MVNRIYSFLFWSWLCISCMVMFVGALLIRGLTLPFDRDGKVLHLYTCFWGHIYFHFNPTWRASIEHRERLPWHGSAILVANHERLGDILLIFGLYRPFKWVSKASVFKTPFLGWNMRLNQYVPLTRGNKDSIGKMMADCEKWIDRGVPIMMFPEGTRSPDGEIQPFKDGAFKMAIDKRVPVIPIVITGSADTLPKHGWVMQAFNDCRVRVMEPVPWDRFGDDVGALRDGVRQMIITERARMLSGEVPRFAA